MSELDLSRELAAIPQPLRETTQRLLQQFQAALVAQQLPNPFDLLSQHITSDIFAEQLVRAFTASEYVAKTCIVHPKYLLDLITSNDLFNPLRDDSLDTLTFEINACTTEQELDKALRQHRHPRHTRPPHRNRRRRG